MPVCALVAVEISERSSFAPTFVAAQVEEGANILDGSKRHPYAACYMTLSPTEYDRVRGFASRVGIREAAKIIGVSRQSLYAMLGGQSVRSGTVALVRLVLERNLDK
jgi:hypothetical protein